MKHGIDRIGRGITLNRAVKGCFDKKMFKTRNAARDWVATKRKVYTDNEPTRPYRCTVCGNWHLTTMMPKQIEDARKGYWHKAPKEPPTRQTIVAPQFSKPGKLPAHK